MKNNNEKTAPLARRSQNKDFKGKKQSYLKPQISQIYTNIYLDYYFIFHEQICWHF